MYSLERRGPAFLAGLHDEVWMKVTLLFCFMLVGLEVCRNCTCAYFRFRTAFYRKKGAAVGYGERAQALCVLSPESPLSA